MRRAVSCRLRVLRSPPLAGSLSGKSWVAGPGASTGGQPREDGATWDVRQSGRTLSAGALGSSTAAVGTTFTMKRRRSAGTVAKHFLLPDPSTVGAGFPRFFTLTAASAVVSFFSMSIATRALLQSFFMDSTPGIWLLKDLAPAILTAFTANAVFSYDHHPRFWFVVAVFLTQVAIVVDFFIPSFVAPAFFLPAAAATSFLKGSAMLMFGISRATILQHFAKTQNVGELTKKVTSLQMVLYTASGAAGLAFASVASAELQTAAVAACFVASLALTRRAVVDIAFTTLTPAVVHRQLNEFRANSAVLSPAAVARASGLWGDPAANAGTTPGMANFLLAARRRLQPVGGGLPVAVSPALEHVDFHGLLPQALFSELRRGGAVVETASVKGEKCVVVLLRRDADIATVLCAFVAALDLAAGRVTAKATSAASASGGPGGDGAAPVGSGEPWWRVRCGAEAAALLAALEAAGWSTASHRIDEPSRRLQFDS